MSPLVVEALADLAERGTPLDLPSVPDVLEHGITCLISYARISDTRKGKSDSTGVTTQHGAIRGRTRRLGSQYLIVRRYTDNDLSSAKNEHRPDFECMVQDLIRGATEDGYPVHGVICTDEDRIYRTPAQWQRFVTAFRSRAGRHFFDYAGYQDLYAEGAEIRGLMNVAISMGEIRKKKTRGRLWHEGRAMRGIPHTGGRPFGYSADGWTLDPTEGPILRRGVEMCNAGAAWTTITAMFQASGIPTRKGGPWLAQTVKQIIANPRNAGLRLIDGEVYLDEETGLPRVGDWETVCSVEELEVVWKRHKPRIRLTNKDILSFSDEPQEPQPRNLDGSVDRATKYLLGGFLRCGRVNDQTGAPCGAKLRGSPNNRGRGLHVYICPAPSAGGCSGVSRSGPPLDQLIEALVIAKLQERAARAAPEGEWKKQSLLNELQGKLDTVGARWVKAEISNERYFKLSATLEEHLGALQAERKAWEKARQARRELPGDVAHRWHHEMDLRQQRATIDEMFSAIVVYPVGKGKQQDKADAVHPVWRTETA